jgi:co-chaperonin GroES (HSP10)
MKFQPLYDRVIVEVSENQRTESGLLIAGQAGPNGQGVVVAVGEGRLLEGGGMDPLKVKVGYTVLWNSGWGQPTSIDGRDYLTFAENELIGYYPDVEVQ